MRKSRADRDISYRTLPEGNVTVKTDNGIFAGSRERYGSAARYIIAGGMTTAVNFAVFALFFEIFGMSVTASNIISVAAAVIFAYIVNKLYVFRSRCPDMQNLAKEFLKFVSARLLTMVAEVGGVLLLVDVLDMQAFAGKLLTQIIVVAGNYFISRLLVFTHSKDHQLKK